MSQLQTNKFVAKTSVAKTPERVDDLRRRKYSAQGLPRLNSVLSRLDQLAKVGTPLRLECQGLCIISPVGAQSQLRASRTESLTWSAPVEKY